MYLGSQTCLKCLAFSYREMSKHTETYANANSGLKKLNYGGKKHDIKSYNLFKQSIGSFTYRKLLKALLINKMNLSINKHSATWSQRSKVLYLELKCCIIVCTCGERHDISVHRQSDFTYGQMSCLNHLSL